MVPENETLLNRQIQGDSICLRELDLRRRSGHPSGDLIGYDTPNDRGSQVQRVKVGALSFQNIAHKKMS